MAKPKIVKSKDKKHFQLEVVVVNKSEEIWLNMARKAHRKAGRIIRQKIEQVVTKNTKPLEKGYYEYFLDDKEVVQ